MPEIVHEAHEVAIRDCEAYEVGPGGRTRLLEIADGEVHLLDVRLMTRNEALFKRLQEAQHLGLRLRITLEMEEPPGGGARDVCSSS